MHKVQLTHAKISAETTLLCVRLTIRLLSVRSRKRLTSQSKCKKERERERETQRKRYRDKKVQREKDIIKKEHVQTHN
jgi:hypothetical protein